MEQPELILIGYGVNVQHRDTDDFQRVATFTSSRCELDDVIKFYELYLRSGEALFANNIEVEEIYINTSNYENEYKVIISKRGGLECLKN